MNINNLEKFKAKIAAGKFCLGASIALTDPSVTEMAADCGFDFVFIDGEHGDIDRKTAMDHLMAIRGTDCASLYRVPCASHTEIKKIIDFAPAGIVVPMVMNAEEAEMVVKAMRYPPFGTRGCGFRRGTGYGTGDFDAYWRASKDDPMTIVQLEHIEAYRDLDRILAVKGLDSILIGPYDLSASMGKAGKWDDPDVRQVFDDACRRILEAGLLLGVSLDDRAEEWRARGVNYMQVMSDLTALRHSWQYMIKSLT